MTGSSDNLGSARAFEQQSGLHADERRSRRRKIAVISVVLVVVVAVSLFVKTGYAGFYNPGEVFECYGMWLHNLLGSIAGSSDLYTSSEMLARHAEYYGIVGRVPITVITLICGCILAIAGSLYQSAFRNPIASPSMLGVSSAIQLGDALLVLVMGGAAALAEGERYLMSYACIVVVLALLFGCGRLMSGKGRPLNVVNLLLIATIINQIIGALITYISLVVFSFEEWQVYNNMSEALSVSYSAESWIMLGLTCLIGLVPVLFVRFRLNALNFNDTEMRLMGVDPARLRVLAIVCGTVLLTGAQVETGTVAMIALVVPHVSRMIFGAEFRKQFWGNAMLGAALLVLCRDLLSFIPYVSGLVPVSVVVNFVVLPFFVWMLATQQRSWGS